MAYQLTLEQIPFVFFQYTYTEHYDEYDSQTGRMERRSRSFTFTVVHAGLTKTVPTILLLHHNFLSKLTAAIESWGMQRLSLEGDFNSHFDTYINKGTEIEALTILQPDVMELLISSVKNPSAEFAGQSFYLIQETGSLSPDSITAMLNNVSAVVKKVSGPFVPQASTPLTASSEGQ